MNTIPSAITVTDLRRKSAEILKNLSDKKLFLLVQNSYIRGAIVDMDYLQTLQEAYEDYLDTLAYDRAVNEPTIHWTAYQKRSQKHT